MRERVRRWSVGASVFAALTASSWVGAQPAPETPPATAAQAEDPNIETARRYFEAGVAAMQRQDWAEAVNGFENSQRLRRTASVSLNLGIVLHRLGRLLAARSELQEFTQNATPAQHAQHDAEVGRILAEIGRRVGRIVIAEVRPAGAAITIDGQPAVLNDEHAATVNPGSHVVRSTADGFTAHEETVTVAEAGTATVRLVLVPVAVTRVAAPTPRVTPEGPASSGSILTRWWFWTGAGLVVAGVAVGLAVGLSGTNDPPPSTSGVVLQGIRIGGNSW
jgi:hypothetical protein